MTEVYNRETKEIEVTKHFGESTLNKVYKSKILTKIATGKLVSKLYGIYNSSIFSRRKIKKFIQKNKIDMGLYEKRNYYNFNEFFIRRLKKYNIDREKKHFISPVQGKLLVYPVTKDLSFEVKGLTYTLEELFPGENLSSYKNGSVFVFRLALDNYHRFHYVDDGKRIVRKRIKGRLHTVSDSSSKYKVFKENFREYSVLQTKNFGEMLYMEVGALLVGKIMNYDYDTFTRGMEKGYFLPGGSTIVLVVSGVTVDKDILKYSEKNIETLVEVGERIGVKK